MKRSYNYKELVLQAQQEAQLAQQGDQPQEKPEPTVTDYLTDVPKGFANGTMGFFQGIAQTADDVSEAFGYDMLEDKWFDPIFETKTMVGSLVSGVTNFAMAMIPAGAALKAVGLAGKLGKAGWAGKLALEGTKDLLAGSIMLQHDTGNFSALIEQVPQLHNPLTEYLAGDPDDSAATKRFKNALEGAGMGLAFKAIATPVKWSYRLAKAKLAEASEETLQKIAAKGAAATKAATEEMHSAASKATDGINLDLGDYPVEQFDPATGELVTPAPAQAAAPTVAKVPSDELANKLASGGVIVDDVMDIVGTRVNLRGANATEEMTTGLTSLIDHANRLEGVLDKAKSSPKTLVGIAASTRQMALRIGANPDELEKMAIQDNEVIPGLASRILVYGADLANFTEMVTKKARELRALNDPLKMREDLGQLITAWEAKARTFFTIRRETAIATTGQRIKIFGTSPDALAIREALQKGGAGGTANTQQAINTLTKALWGQNAIKTEEALIEAMERSPKSTRNLLHDPNAMQVLVGGLAAADGDLPTIALVFNTIDKAGKKTFNGFMTYWINAQLSSLRVATNNIVGGTFMSTIKPVERALGSMWTQDPAALHSAARVSSNLVAQSVDVFGIIRRALKNPDYLPQDRFAYAWKALKSGESAIDPMHNKWDQQQLASATGPVMKYLVGALNLPVKLLAAGDDLVKATNATAYIRDKVWRELETEYGSNLAKMDDSLIKKLISEKVATKVDMKTGMVSDPEVMQLMREVTQARDPAKGSLTETMLNIASKHPTTRLFVPFIRVPANIARTTWEMTPVLNLANHDFMERMWSSNPTVAADARGRYLLGGMFWTIALAAAKQGYITGRSPQNAQLANQQADAGAQEYSFVIPQADGTKRYYGFNRLDVIGNILGIAADLAQASHHMSDDELEVTAGSLSGAIARNLTSKTYMAGLAHLTEFLSDMDKYGATKGEAMAISLMPTIMADIKDDPYLLAARSQIDAFVDRIPGMKSDSPPVRNMLGDPVESRHGWLPGFLGGEGTQLANMVSPIAFSKSATEEVKQEIANLGFSLTKMPTKINGIPLQYVKNDTGQDALDRLQELEGKVKVGDKTLAEALHELVKSDRYQAWRKPISDKETDNPRIVAIEKLRLLYHNKAVQQIHKEYPALKDIEKQIQEAFAARKMSYVQQLTGIGPNSPRQ